jgi:hypothetical protein
MAQGILGQADLSAVTNTTVYTTPADKKSKFTVSFCNRGSSATTVRLALTLSTGAPFNYDYLEYNAVLPVGGVLERTDIICDQGRKVVAYSDNANVTVMIYGEEGII